jgi:hypothetical protein
LCNFLQFSIAYSLLDPNIFLSSLFLNILGLYSPLMWKIRFQTHAKKTGKAIVLYVLILTPLDCRREGKYSEHYGSKYSSNLLLVSSWMQFWLLLSFRCIWTLPLSLHFSRFRILQIHCYTGEKYLRFLGRSSTQSLISGA